MKKRAPRTEPVVTLEVRANSKLYPSHITVTLDNAAFTVTPAQYSTGRDALARFRTSVAEAFGTFVDEVTR